jgi:hypothetical protein
MSLSVSSERAFSKGGITISKQRSCLKGDIVEALQCIKCAIRHDLLFREPAPSSRLEVDEGSDAEQENAGVEGEPGVEADDGEMFWDGQLSDGEDNTLYYSD